MPAASSTWRTATYVKSGGEGTASDRTASRPSSSPGSSSSRSGPCSTRKRSYRARRRASPRDRARITRRKSGPRRRPRTLARIMTTPPIDAATPQAPLALLERLTTLSRELAGAFRPSTVVALVARALTELLRPDRLSIVLLDVETNRLAVAYDSAPVPAVTDDPLLQLALRRGPLVLARDVAAEAARLGVALGDAAPASWIGAPLIAGGRAIGAVSLGAGQAGAFGDAEQMIMAAVVAQAAIALENARLVELLSSGKREWERTVDAITQAICLLDAQGVVRRANRIFAGLLGTPLTPLPRRPWLGLLPPVWADPAMRALADPRNKIGRAHVCTPVTVKSRMPSS